MITASISGKKSGNAEELPGASVLVVRRNDLFLRVHHEGTAGYDRLAERLAREDDGAHAVSAARQRNDALLVGSRQPGDLARSDLGVGPANHAVALDDDDEAVIPCRQQIGRAHV